jgi:FAD/FMN-containing dehydrogenase
MIPTSAVEQLRRSLRGALLKQGDDGYDRARTIHNATIDRHPALIARCTCTEDVQHAVSFARDHGMVLAVRAGGHNVVGFAVCDGGLMIDLTAMKAVSVDADARTVRVEGGATWGDVNDALQPFDLAATGGFVSITGVGGLTLGGGLGWLLRKHGLALDNLLSAEMVTADGKVLTTNPTSHPDLFWAIRGGGGNFGVVTSFEFSVYPAGTVLAGQVVHPLDRAEDALKAYARFCAGASESFTSGALFFHFPDDPALPPPARGAAVVGLGGVYTGPLERGERELQPLRSHGTPLLDLFEPMPYSNAQRMADGLWPPGLHNYWKSAFLTSLSPEAIATLVKAYRAVPSPFTVIVVEHFGDGAASRVGERETAFGHREWMFNCVITAAWRDASEAESNMRWLRDAWDAMRPHLAAGAYVNYLGEADPASVVAAYGNDKYARLTAVKTAYDPKNLFCMNQNIVPAKAAGMG